MSIILHSIILPIVSSALNLIPAMYFFRRFSDGKRDKALTAVLPAFIIFTLTLIFVKLPLLKLLITALCTFAYTFAQRIRHGVRVLLTVSYIAVSMISEVLTGMTISSVLVSDYAISQSGIFNLIGMLASKLVTLTFCTIIAYSAKDLPQSRSGKQWAALYILPLSTFFVMTYEHFSLYSVPKDSDLRIVAGISMLLLITGNLLVFRIADGIHKAIETENKLLLSEELVKKQSEQYDILFENSRDMLKLRHDHKNFLLGVISEAESGNTDSAIEMLRKELDMITSPEKSSICGNSIIDTVISHKRTSLSGYGITIDLRYRGTAGIKLPGSDLSVLLGNAIDNAADAVKKLSDTDKRRIDVAIAVINGMLCITVSNPVEKDIDTTDLSTTKSDPHLHGFGILGMHSVAAKHEGSIVFKCEDKVFSVIMNMSNK